MDVGTVRSSGLLQSRCEPPRPDLCVDMRFHFPWLPTLVAAACIADEDTLGSRRQYCLTCRSAPVSVPAVSRLISSPLSRSVSVILAILTGVQLPRWLNSKEPACQCRRFSPWVGKLSRRRTWQPTPAFLPRQSHGQRSLAGYGPRSQRIRHS